MSQADFSKKIAEFDHHAPDHHEGVGELWSAMRTLPGLAHSKRYGGFYVATRYADVMAAATNHKVYISGAGINIPDLPIHTALIPVEVDPPMHREYRDLLTRFLTRERVASLEPEVRRLTRDLLDALRDRNTIEFVEDFARQLPVMVALKLLGLPLADARRLHHLSFTQRAERGTSKGAAAAAELGQYLEDIIIRHQKMATDADRDVLSAITLGKVDGREMSLEEKISIVRLLIFGGFDTTAIALTSAMHWLATHSEDAEALRRSEKKIDRAIEEFVRFSSPGSYLRRTAAQDTDLGGCPLHKGDRVIIAFAAANRDPAKFECPDEVRLDRFPNPHVGFGAGVHRCIGSFVAKLEMKVALEEFLKRYRDISLESGGKLGWECGENLGINALPLRVHGAVG
jgi:cytochrome P450